MAKLPIEGLEEKKAETNSSTSNLSINFKQPEAAIIEALCAYHNLSRRNFGETMLDVFLSIFGKKTYKQLTETPELPINEIKFNRLWSIYRDMAGNYSNGDANQYLAWLRFAASLLAEAAAYTTENGKPALATLLDIVQEANLKKTDTPRTLAIMLEYFATHQRARNELVALLKEKCHGREERE
jgi:hypothetical protein